MMLPLVHLFGSPFSYNLLMPNVIVKIRTRKGNEMEYFFFFFLVVGRPTACILWAALVSSLSLPSPERPH